MCDRVCERGRELVPECVCELVYVQVCERMR